jgi:GNAT superfamily N-acetyltransferase
LELNRRTAAVRKRSRPIGPAPVRVRPARLGDERELDGLYRQLHGRGYVSPGAAKMRRGLRAVLNNRDQTLLVAIRDGRIVGTNHVLIFRHLGRALRPVAIVENVVVDAHCRGAKVGEQLMAAAVEIARRHNCYKVALTSNRKRTRAHRFYERLGWQWTHFGYALALPK